MPAHHESRAVVACLQFEPVIGHPEANLDTGAGMIEKAAGDGANLIVLPELCDSGYVFETRDEAYALSGTAEESATIVRWRELAVGLGVHIVGGFCERAGDALYNSAAIVGPGGVLGVYRKNHLWAAEALFFERGDVGFPVVRTPMGRVAALICYDGWFPESWRLCALQGADIVCVPTNWVPMPNQPDDQLAMANILCMAGAHSNSVFVAAACRTGTERGQPFIGQSIIVSHTGWPLAGPASKTEPAILMAECNLSDARRRRTLNEFNQVLRDRRADVYGEMLGAEARPGWY
jgi:predicted amidohydrolase